jgi:hypothetical protein
MTNQQHIDHQLSLLRTILEEASEKIEALKPGERLPATQLAHTIAAKYEINGIELYTVLKLFLFKGYPGVKFNKGRNGGIEKLEETITETIKESNDNQIKEGN